MTNMSEDYSIGYNQGHADGRRKAIDDARQQARSAIDELRRWQYSGETEEVRHSIDMAIRTLERI